MPQAGLLVSNHLGYLDILTLGALTPSVFVAKRDVKHWPILAGSLVSPVRCSPTAKEIPGCRTDQRHAIRPEQWIRGDFVPEGTSSDGQTVLPFKSSLLEPATACPHPLSTSLISYRLEDGDVAEEVCYWKDMTLVPHLINLLSKKGIEVSVQFSQLRKASSNRKELARQLHSEVLKLKQLQHIRVMA